MKPLSSKKELSNAFMSLENINRAYVLGVTHALTFVQNSTKDPSIKPSNESKPTVASRHT